jgi:hypothetical protein
VTRLETKKRVKMIEALRDAGRDYRDLKEMTNQELQDEIDELNGNDSDAFPNGRDLNAENIDN